MSPRPPASPSTIEGSHLLRAEGLDLGYRTPLLREVTLEGGSVNMLNEKADAWVSEAAKTLESP